MKRRYLALFMALVITCSQVMGTGAFVMAEETSVEHVHEEAAEEELELLSDVGSEDELAVMSLDADSELLLADGSSDEAVLSDDELLSSDEESGELVITDMEVIEVLDAEEPETETEGESESDSEEESEMTAEAESETETEELIAEDFLVTDVAEVDTAEVEALMLASDEEGETYYDYQYNFCDCTMLPGWENRYDRYFNCYVESDGEVHNEDVEITGFDIDEATDRMENGDYVVSVDEWDDGNGWTVGAHDGGYARIKVTYELVDGSGTAEEYFDIWIGNDVYSISLDTENGITQILPGDRLMLLADISHECYDPEQGHYSGTTDDIGLEFVVRGDAGDKFSLEEVTWIDEEGQTQVDPYSRYIVASANAAGYGEHIEVRAYQLDENGDYAYDEDGNKIELAYSDIGVEARETFMNILPKNIESNLYVGESTALTPELWSSDAGTGSTVQLTENMHFVWSWDPEAVALIPVTGYDDDGNPVYGNQLTEDENNWSNEATTGEVAVRKLRNWDTSVVVKAETYDEESGSWNYAYERRYDLNSMRYDLWLDGMLEEDSSWVFNGYEAELSLNTDNLPEGLLDKDEYEILWEPGIWSDEEEQLIVFDDDTVAKVLTDKGTSVTLNGTALAEIEAVKERGGIDLRVNVLANGADVYSEQRWIGVEEPVWDYQHQYGGWSALPGDQLDIDSTFNCRINNGNYPYGQDFDVNVVSVTINEENSDEDAARVEEWSDENGHGWTLYADGMGYAQVDVKYEVLNDLGEKTENTEIHSFGVWVDGAVYGINVQSESGTEEVLPGYTISFSMNPWLRLYDAETGEHYDGDVEDVYLKYELGDGNKDSFEIVKAGRRSCSVRANDDAGAGSNVQVQVRAYVLDENDVEQEVAYSEFWIRIGEEFTNILPTGIDSELAVLDETFFTPELWVSRAEDGSENLVTENIRFRWNWDSEAVDLLPVTGYDTEGNPEYGDPLTADDEDWSDETTTGEVAVRKLKNWSTRVTVRAERLNEESGEWYEAGARDYWLNEQDYGIWFEELRGDGYTWLYNDPDSELELYLNTDHLNDKNSENYEIIWEAGIWNDEAQDLVTFDTDGITVNTDNGGISAVLNGAVLAQEEEISGNDNWFDLRVKVVANDEEVSACQIGVQVRDTYMHTDFPENQQLLPGWDMDISEYYNLWIEDNEDPLGVDTQARVTGVDITDHDPDREAEEGALINCEELWDDAGNHWWNLYMNRGGSATVTLYYECDRTGYTDYREYSFDIYVPNDIYSVNLTSDTGTDTMLTSGSLNLTASLWYEGCRYDEEQGEMVYESYVPENVTLEWSVSQSENEEIITIAPHATEADTYTVTAGADAAHDRSAVVEVRAYINENEEVDYASFEVYIRDGYYVIEPLPADFDSEQDLGTVQKITPVLYWYGEGEEEGLEITENVRFRWNWDSNATALYYLVTDEDTVKESESYLNQDGKGWSTQYTDGEVCVYRSGDWDTHVALTADVYDEESERWETEVYYREYRLSRKSYGINFEDLRGDGYSWFYTDEENVEVKISLENLTDGNGELLENCEILWEIGPCDRVGNISDLRDGNDEPIYTVSDDGTEVTIPIEAMKELGYEPNFSIEARARVYLDGIEVACESRGYEIRNPEYKYEMYWPEIWVNDVWGINADECVSGSYVNGSSQEWTSENVTVKVTNAELVRLQPEVEEYDHPDTLENESVAAFTLDKWIENEEEIGWIVEAKEIGHAWIELTCELYVGETKMDESVQMFEINSKKADIQVEPVSGTNQFHPQESLGLNAAAFLRYWNTEEECISFDDVTSIFELYCEGCEDDDSTQTYEYLAVEETDPYSDAEDGIIRKSYEITATETAKAVLNDTENPTNEVSENLILRAYWIDDAGNRVTDDDGNYYCAAEAQFEAVVSKSYKVLEPVNVDNGLLVGDGIEFVPVLNQYSMNESGEMEAEEVENTQYTLCWDSNVIEVSYMNDAGKVVLADENEGSDEAVNVTSYLPLTIRKLANDYTEFTVYADVYEDENDEPIESYERTLALWGSDYSYGFDEELYGGDHSWVYTNQESQTLTLDVEEDIWNSEVYSGDAPAAEVSVDWQVVTYDEDGNIVKEAYAEGENPEGEAAVYKIDTENNSIEIDIAEAIKYFGLEAEERFDVEAFTVISGVHEDPIVVDHAGTHFYVYNPYYEYHASSVILGDEIRIEQEQTIYAEDAECPHGGEKNAVITGVKIAEVQSWQDPETEGEEGSWVTNTEIEVNLLEPDEENDCWRIQADDFCRILVDITYQFTDSYLTGQDPLEDVEFYVNGDEWYFGWHYPRSVDQILQYNELWLGSWLHQEYLNEEGERSRESRENYYLEVLYEDEEGNALFDTGLVEVWTEDGEKTLVIRANEKFGETYIPVRIMMVNDDGSEWELWTEELHVCVVDGYYVFENDEVPSIVYVGDTLDLNEYNPVVYYCENGEEDILRDEVDAGKIRYTLEYDEAIWEEVTDTGTESALPVLRRIDNNGTEIGLRVEVNMAGEGEDDNWQEICYDTFGFDDIEYKVQLEYSYGDHRVYSDEPLMLTAVSVGENTLVNLADPESEDAENYSIEWLVNPDEDSETECLELTGGKNLVGEDAPNSAVLTGKEGYDGQWVTICAVIYYGDAPIAEGWTDVEVKDPVKDYRFEDSWELLPGEEKGFDVSRKGWLENAENQDGIEFDYEIVKVTVESDNENVLVYTADASDETGVTCSPENDYYNFRAKNAGEATVTVYYQENGAEEDSVTIHVTVAGDRYFLNGDYQEHTDCVLPGEELIISTYVDHDSYDIDTDQHHSERMTDYKLALADSDYDTELIEVIFDGSEIKVQTNEKYGYTEFIVYAYVENGEEQQVLAYQTFSVRVTSWYTVMEAADHNEELPLGCSISRDEANAHVYQYECDENGILTNKVEREDVYFAWDENSIDWDAWDFDGESQTLTRKGEWGTSVDLCAYNWDGEELGRWGFWFNELHYDVDIDYSYGSREYSRIYSDTPLTLTLNQENVPNEAKYSVAWEVDGDSVNWTKKNNTITLKAGLGCDGEQFAVRGILYWNRDGERVVVAETETWLEVRNPIYYIAGLDEYVEFIVSENMYFAYDKEAQGYPVNVYAQDALNPYGNEYPALITAITGDNQELWTRTETENGVTFTAINGGNALFTFTVTLLTAAEEAANIPQTIEMGTGTSHNTYYLNLWTEGSNAEGEMLIGDELQIGSELHFVEYSYSEEDDTEAIIDSQVEDGYYLTYHDYDENLIAVDEDGKVTTKESRGETRVKVIAWSSKEVDEEDNPLYLADEFVRINVTGQYYEVTADKLYLSLEDEYTAFVPKTTRYSLTVSEGEEVTEEGLSYTVTDWNGEFLAVDGITVKADGQALELTQEDDPMETSVYIEVANADGEVLGGGTAMAVICNHSIEEKVLTAATCVAEGEKQYTCKKDGCGKVWTEKIEKKAHKASSTWTTTKAAACTAAGTKVQYCEYGCGTAVNTGSIAATGHTAGTWKVTTAATCTKAGVQKQYCTVCNAEVASKAIAATGHTAGTWKVTTAATCTKAGVQKQYCTVCNAEVVSKTIAATGHTAGTWKTTTAATCTEAGEQKQYCTVCSTELASKEIAATGHNFGNWAETSDSTKAVPKEAHKCTNKGCSETEIRTMTLAATSLKLRKNQTTTKFVITDMAEGDYVKSIKSNKPKIVTVKSYKANGACTLKAAKSKTGSATLTIELASGLKRTVKVTVQKSKVTTTSVKLTTKKITISKKGKYTIVPILNPITTQDKLTFTSKNKKIATVNSKGVVTGKKKGKTTITVKCGKKKATLTVTVK